MCEGGAGGERKWAGKKEGVFSDEEKFQVKGIQKGTTKNYTRRLHTRTTCRDLKGKKHQKKVEGG